MSLKTDISFEKRRLFASELVAGTTPKTRSEDL
jgi:hypothetical protein